MKTRLKSNQEVAHVWAQQKQYEGRASTVFFQDKSIFSYGEHFEMARFVTPEIVLFTDRQYSVTTSGHLSMARSAVSHKTIFTVPSFTDHNENAREMAKAIRAEVDRLNRSTAAWKWGINYLDDQIKHAEDYLNAFGRKVKGPARKEIREAKNYRFKILSTECMAEKKKCFEENAKKREVLEKYYAEHPEVEEAQRRKRVEAKQRKIVEQQKKRIEAWKRGESIYGGYDWPMMLRVKGDSIETSRGASIPLLVARKLWRRFLSNKASLIGLDLGHYTVNALEIDANYDGPETKGTLIVGCHRIPVSELYRMADILGWRNGVPLEISEVVS